MGAVTTNGPEPDDSAALHEAGKSGFRRTERRIEEPHEFRDAVTGIDIAYAHGMPHLGRFAASYRALFGENPVETLKRP